MSDKITSADIKKALSNASGGQTEEKDWKRLSKKKDSDQNWVREFEHKKTGMVVEVKEIVQHGTEKAQLFARVTKNAAAVDFERAAGKPAPQPQTAGFFPSIETDAEKNKIADEVIEKLLDQGDGYEDAHAQAPAAGKALANRFCFAIQSEPHFDAIGAAITPISLWEKEGYMYDQLSPIAHLLPDGADDTNEGGNWFWESDGSTPLDVAKDLMARGFIWRRDFQESTDEGCCVDNTPLIEAIEKERLQQGVAASNPRGCKPKP